MNMAKAQFYIFIMAMAMENPSEEIVRQKTKVWNEVNMKNKCDWDGIKVLQKAKHKNAFLFSNTVYYRFGHKIKSSEWGEGEWQMKMTVNDKRKARLKNQRSTPGGRQS
jgi:hypothetical protein